jgi:hypothetical protein
MKNPLLIFFSIRFIIKQARGRYFFRYHSACLKVGELFTYNLKTRIVISREISIKKIMPFQY